MSKINNNDRSPSPKRYCAVVLDFDNTMANFKDGKKELFEIFKKNKIKEEIIEKTYEKTKKNGFDFDFFIKETASLSKQKINFARTKKEMENWLKNNLILMKQGEILLKKIKKNKIPFIISTFGNPEFQYKKIKTLKIKPDLIIFHTDPPKITMLKNLLTDFEKEIKNGQKILFIDDTKEEIHAVKNSNFAYAFHCVCLNSTEKENLEAIKSLQFQPK